MKYLAIGDSYTIGEQVETAFNFPNQLIQKLQTKFPKAYLSSIIATTGWTTDELALALEKQRPDWDHDLVTLLIGVNNQYRGRPLEEYRWQFYGLLCQSVLFAKSIPKNVIVLSIPDWGLTPFNQTKDKAVVSAEIDAFNQINKEMAEQFGCRYLDITESTRQHAQDTEFLAPDLLHYSASEYTVWAQGLYTLLFPED